MSSRRLWPVAVAIVAAATFAAPAGAAAPSRLFWTSQPALGTIGQANLDGSGASALLQNTMPLGYLNEPGLIDDGHHLLWTDSIDAPGLGLIGRSNLDGTGLQPSFITGASRPQGIAVDGQHIYWTNARDGSIGRANADGTDVEQHFIPADLAGRATNLDGIAVAGGHIYWADFTLGSASISRADLDGTHVDRQFIAGLDAPAGLAVDGEHLYWASPDQGTIGRARLDGTYVRPAFVTGAAGAFSVAVDADHVYWSSPSQSEIGRASIDGSHVDPAFIGGVFSPFGLAVSQPVIDTDLSTVAFGGQAAGSSSAAHRVTIANRGEAPLRLSGRITGPDTDDFVLSSSTCDGAVAPGATCQIGVRFAPGATGARTATLELDSNDATHTPLDVALTGSGSDPLAGAPGPAGPTGPAGAPGATGPAGPAGPASRVVCRNTAAARLLCDVLFPAGTWTASATRAVAARFVLRHGHHVVRQGRLKISSRGRARLVLTPRPRHGTYRLTVTVGHRHRVVVRRTIAL
jgi:virginiamycin B lyase